MRHRRKTVKLQRTSQHRRCLLANLACSLIEHRQIKTTLAKAKALKPIADKMVTLGKRDSVHARRQALGYLRQKGESIWTAVAAHAGGVYVDLYPKSEILRSRASL